MLLGQSDTGGALTAAVIAAAVSLLVALLGWWAGARRDQVERRYQRRRAALLDLQDAALRLRGAIADYAWLSRQHPNQRPAELVAAEQVLDRAAGLLEVTVVRVEDEQVRELVTRWRQAAQVAFVSVQDEVAPAAEREAWSRFNRRVGAALRSSSGTSGDAGDGPARRGG